MYVSLEASFKCTMQGVGVCGNCNGIVMLGARGRFKYDKRIKMQGPRPKKEERHPEQEFYGYNPEHVYSDWYDYGWKMNKLKDWLYQRLCRIVPVAKQPEGFMAEVGHIDGAPDQGKVEGVEISEDYVDVKKMVEELLLKLGARTKETVPAEWEEPGFEETEEWMYDNDSRVMYETEAFLTKPTGNRHAVKSHFKVGIYHDTFIGSMDYAGGQYVLYIADMK